VAKVGTSNQDRTISLKAAVRSCINKQTISCRWANHVALKSREPITLCRSFVTETKEFFPFRCLSFQIECSDVWNSIVLYVLFVLITADRSLIGMFLMYTSIVIKGTACRRRGSKCVRRVYLWGSVNLEDSGKYASMVRVDEWT